jgi:hypothetical protein
MFTRPAPLVPILCQLQFTYSHPTSLWSILILLSCLCLVCHVVSSLQVFWGEKKSVLIFLSHVCYMPHPSHPPWIDYPNNIWWSIQVMKPLIMQSSSALSRSFQRICPILRPCVTFCYLLFFYSKELLPTQPTPNHQSKNQSSDNMCSQWTG